MFRNNNVEEKAAKTAILLGATNLVLAPLACLVTNRPIGLALAIAANAFALYQLCKLGQSRRPGANAVTWLSSFASSRLPTDANVGTNELENTFRNIINGGAAITDEIVNGVEQLSNIRPR